MHESNETLLILVGGNSGDRKRIDSQIRSHLTQPAQILCAVTVSIEEQKFQPSDPRILQFFQPSALRSLSRSMYVDGSVDITSDLATFWNSDLTKQHAYVPAVAYDPRVAILNHDLFDDSWWPHPHSLINQSWTVNDCIRQLAMHDQIQIGIWAGIFVSR